MEPTSSRSNQYVQEVSQPQTDVGFPPPPTREKSSNMGKIIFAVAGVLIIIGVGLYLLLKGTPGLESEPSPIPENEESLSSFFTPTPEPTMAPTATPGVVNRDEVKIQVLNGSGVPGDAAYLKDELEKLGYGDIVTGNAESQGETITTVSFAAGLNSDLTKEITTKLESLYKEVRTRKESLPEGISVKIITGTKKGTSVKPSVSPSPSPSV